jgi:hypothetical protein
MSFLTHLDNHTPFAAERLVLMGPEGQEWFLLLVCATFEQLASGEMQLAAAQVPIRATDEYFGDPTLSSLRYASDVALAKPNVDVVVNGCAYAPPNRMVTSLEVSIRLGSLHKSVRIRSDRPFASMPVTYERAYGGTRLGDAAAGVSCCTENPVGIGFKGARSADPLVTNRDPIVEHAVHAGQNASGPAGFGPIARGWQPRAAYAGTFDAEWRERRWPLLPTDYDARFEQIAPADQQMPALEGGERVELEHLTPDGRWAFRLPVINAPAFLLYRDRAVGLRLRTDTVLIEPDLRRVRMTCRVALRARRDEQPPLRIVVGHLSRAQARAYRGRKKYVGRGFDPSANYLI